MEHSATAHSRTSVFPARHPRLRRGLRWGSLLAAISLAALAVASHFVEPQDWFVAATPTAGRIDPQGQRFDRMEYHVLIGYGMVVWRAGNVYTWNQPFTDDYADVNSHALAIHVTFNSGTLPTRGWTSLFWPSEWQWYRALKGYFDWFVIPITWFIFPFLFAFLWLSKRDRRLSKHGHCLKCAYDTRGVPLTSPCPECGHWKRIA